MRSMLRLKASIKNPPLTQAGAIFFAMLALLAGCRSQSNLSSPSATLSAATPDLDAEIARASNLHRPILLLIAESGLSKADDQAQALFETWAVKDNRESIVSVLLDVGVSRNRVEAAWFHATNTPVLVGLSPRGVIMTRDQMPITKELVLSRIENIKQRAREMDAKFAPLEEAAAKDGNDVTAQLELADFLLAQRNAREAIPHLAAVAHSESADPARRVRAWVELARAHFWIAEPEKGRHEAQDLITVLGPKMAEARAGGNLTLGTQDATAKRMALARREFEAAIAAAPESDYAKQAAEALAKLPGEAK
jgi:hypothetical protein